MRQRLLCHADRMYLSFLVPSSRAYLWRKRMGVKSAHRVRLPNIKHMISHIFPGPLP